MLDVVELESDRFPGIFNFYIREIKLILCNKTLLNFNNHTWVLHKKYIWKTFSHLFFHYSYWFSSWVDVIVLRYLQRWSDQVTDIKNLYARNIFMVQQWIYVSWSINLFIISVFWLIFALLILLFFLSWCDCFTLSS